MTAARFSDWSGRAAFQCIFSLKHCSFQTIEHFQFEMLRLSNHTACRFAEKARFFAHFGPCGAGRPAFCLFQRQDVLAIRPVRTIVGRRAVRSVIGAVVLFLILVRRRRWRRAMIRTVSVAVMIVAVRRAAAAENRAADQQQAGQNQSQITCHGDLPGYDVLRPSSAWERRMRGTAGSAQAVRRKHSVSDYYRHRR